ncbi:MAG TPA: helicase-related protein [Streptosporangiaceae bacterium]|nr:helicase-related protein [Streptosporangiaceae bacterium]
MTEIPAAVAAELSRLRAENARLLKMLELSPQQAAPPGPAQAGFFDAPPGAVHKDSPNEAKVAFFQALFAARTDVYATRIENSRTGWKGWLPAVRGGWQRGIPHEKRDYLPLTAGVLAAHLKGDAHVGVYPLLDGDKCWWQVVGDVLAALGKGRHCLVLTNRTGHLERFAGLLRKAGHDPVILCGGMGAKSRAAALARLQPQLGGPPLLVVATGSYAGEGFDCPALDTLFLAAPVANKGSLIQYAGRILRSHEDKTTAEVHDYLDVRTGVLAAMLAKRAPGYAGIGFPDPRKLVLTPSAGTCK